MIREIKYTTDNKKVVVIGNLNSQEKIVQEIFIIDGIEIPSGEHFIAKTLHDSRAISWKEKKMEEIEERYNNEMNRYENKMNKNIESHAALSNQLEARINYIASALKKADETSFQRLVDFITGKIKWVVVNRYELKLLSIQDFHKAYGNKLRLICLFGNDDGSFNYRINEYSDNSGNDIEFYPFNEYEEALSKLKVFLLDQPVCESNIVIAEKHGIEYPYEKLNTYKDNRIAYFKKNIELLKHEIETNEQKIEKISKNSIN